MPYILIATLLLTPAYALRFVFFGVPVNLLMLWVVFAWIFTVFNFSAKKLWPGFFNFLKNQNKKLLIFIFLFLLSGIFAVFIKGIDKSKIAQFVVLFLQPISIFFIGGFVLNQQPKAKDYLLFTVYCLLALAGVYAVLQYFTLLGLPQAWWGNSVEPKRAISFFSHPNFYALFSTPLLALLIPDVSVAIQNLKVNGKLSITNCLKGFAWILGAAGLLLSFSRAGWLGLAAAIGVYLIVAANKKIRQIINGAAIIIIVVIVVTPNLRWRLILPFYGERSADSRIELWQSGLRGVKESPILGLGLNGYAKEYRKLVKDDALETHNFPHNIFLDFWVETGLLGLISFICIISFYIYNGLKNRQDIIALGVSLFLIALLVQGQIDNPYFKNDLAMVFWIILALTA